MRDIVGHRNEQVDATILVQLARTLGRGQRDLDVDLVVRTIDARRIIDEISVDPAAMQRKLDPRSLCRAKVGALTDDLCTHFVGRNA